MSLIDKIARIIKKDMEAKKIKGWRYMTSSRYSPDDMGPISDHISTKESKKIFDEMVAGIKQGVSVLNQKEKMIYAENEEDAILQAKEHFDTSVGYIDVDKEGSHKLIIGGTDLEDITEEELNNKTFYVDFYMVHCTFEEVNEYPYDDPSYEEFCDSEESKEELGLKAKVSWKNIDGKFTFEFTYELIEEQAETGT